MALRDLQLYPSNLCARLNKGIKEIQLYLTVFIEKYPSVIVLIIPTSLISCSVIKFIFYDNVSRILIICTMI